MTLAASLVAASALAACGDDTTAKGTVDAKRSDAAGPDAPVDTMFDMMPTATVSATVAITDVALSDPDSLVAPTSGGPGGIGGGSILISFSDLTQGGGTVLAGTSNVNGCLVVKYDPTHPPNPLLDAGAISIANEPSTETPATGLLKTVGPCTLQAAFGGYTCISHASTTDTVSAVGNGASGTVTYTFSSGLTGQKLVGSYLVINGAFTNTKYNSGASAFPIVQQPADNVLIVLNPGAAGGTLEADVAGVHTDVLNGFLPVPLAGPGNNAGADFLGTGSIKVTSAGNSVWPALNEVVDVTGEGWTLSDGTPVNDGTSNTLYTGTAPNGGVKFGCSGNGGTATCGNGSTQLIQAMIVSGHATKGSLTTGCNGGACQSFQMPTDVPGTDTWVEFQCAFIGSQTATLDKAALQAIIDFQPTRVETRVLNVAGNIIHPQSMPLNTLNLLVGHGYVGHSTPQ